MPSSDLAAVSASELAELYQRGAASPVEATQAALERIDAFNGTYNAYCLVDEEAALSQAHAAEQRWQQGTPLSPLDGVTASIKDLVLTRGWPTLRGSLAVDPDQPWDEDAPATARLREAGVVLLGKTTTPEFGWKGVTDSRLTGVTGNPWNSERTSGGSSGGAAVAAALGMGCLHIGSDGGGSIRIPAGFSGIFGHKPTFGLVPAYPPSPFGTVAHLGPMTRTVTDAALMLNSIGQPDYRDWHALTRPFLDFTSQLDKGIEGLRIAVSTTLGYAEVDPAIARLVEEAAEVLASLGAKVEARDPRIEDPHEIFKAHWFTGAANLRRRFTDQQVAKFEPELQAVCDAGAAIPHMDYIDATDQRAALALGMAEFHQEFDILLTPTLPIPAFEAGRLAPAGTDQSNWTHWTPFSYPFNLTQQPAASIPCGFTADGLPAGLQIVAAKFNDDLVLRVARAYERECPIKLPTPRGEAATA